MGAARPGVAAKRRPAVEEALNTFREQDNLLPGDLKAQDFPGLVAFIDDSQRVTDGLDGLRTLIGDQQRLAEQTAFGITGDLYDWLKSTVRRMPNLRDALNRLSVFFKSTGNRTKGAAAGPKS